MAEWLYDARKACKKGAPICLFIDWRQYPSITDALQWAGWIWRGTAVWDKGNSRPQKGRFRQQAEYIVWGSNGPMPVNRPVSCLPGVFRYGNLQNRIHVTEKPPHKFLPVFFQAFLYEKPPAQTALFHKADGSVPFFFPGNMDSFHSHAFCPSFSPAAAFMKNSVNVAVCRKGA